MPRLELTASDEKTYQELSDWIDRHALSTTTFDFCAHCADGWRGIPIEEMEHSDELICPSNGEPAGNYELDGDVEHPPYSDSLAHFTCAMCGTRLTSEDD